MSAILYGHLQQFREHLNTNIKLRKLLGDWNIHVVLRATDPEINYTLVVENGYLIDIVASEIIGPKMFVAEATYQTFVEIFTGKLNPTEAVIDGDMSTYGEDKDESLLDGIILIIWGF
ncbi:SCP2 sterol-binding domain-containing protein [Chitinophaga sp. 22321]|uniref:SCP2 sterol-binding domain-containing protein n=1 Tax=Chitinophaga hostae TaxID=2831022 RepID=A0ABS5J980_9BACT|nr:SCP2 sterol-binding domain-containing protein [Chitinophaga hostae]MBS0031775.1 SCP2 sterol-binding domain-containing protein [Chitinophaga hostae]